MNLAEAMKRIEELERKVRELEARPAQQQHIHYHQHPAVPPMFWPMPSMPQPFVPHWIEVTCTKAIELGPQWTAAQAQ